MEVQNIGQMEADIENIKVAVSKLVTLLTEVSLHNKRIEYIEAQNLECSADRKEIWKSIQKTHEECLIRNATYQDAKLFFSRREDKVTMRSPDEWLTVLLGGAMRNGVWIAISTMITAIIMRHYGG